MQINDLVEDAFLRILYYLPFEELVKLERVDSCWKELIRIVLKGWKSGLFYQPCTERVTLSPYSNHFCSNQEHRRPSFVAYKQNLSWRVKLKKFKELRGKSFHDKCPNIRSVTFASSLIGPFLKLEHISLPNTNVLENSKRFIQFAEAHTSTLRCLELSIVAIRTGAANQKLFLRELWNLVKICPLLELLRMGELCYASDPFSGPRQDLCNALEEKDNLQHLEMNVHDNERSMESLITICLLKKLKTLCIRFNWIDFASLAALKDMDHLKTIELYSDTISWTGFTIQDWETILISTNFKLKLLNVKQLPIPEPFIGQLLAKYAPNLKSLAIRCQHSDNSLLKADVQLPFHIDTLKKLRVLHVSYIFQIRQLEAILQNGPKLRSIRCGRIWEYESEYAHVRALLMNYANAHPKRYVTVHYVNNAGSETADPSLFNVAPNMKLIEL